MAKKQTKAIVPAASGVHTKAILTGLAAVIDGLEDHHALAVVMSESASPAIAAEGAKFHRMVTSLQAIAHLFGQSLTGNPEWHALYAVSPSAPTEAAASQPAA